MIEHGACGDSGLCWVGLVDLVNGAPNCQTPESEAELKWKTGQIFPPRDGVTKLPDRQTGTIKGFAT